MRSIVLQGIGTVLAAAAAVGCGSSGGSGPSATPLTVESPAIAVDSGVDTIYCVFLHTPNSAQVAVKSWKATLPTGVQSAAILFTASDAYPVGTVSGSSCSPTGANGIAATLLFDSRASTDELDFPLDDGSGTPVAAIVPSGQPAYLWIHVINATGASISPQVQFTATTYPAGTAVTRADPFVTYNGNISIPPSSTGVVAVDSCPTPAGAKFFNLTMLTHIYATGFGINDGATAKFSGTDWADPGALVTLTTPFTAFASGKLTYSCTYSNPTGATITSGQSFRTNEVCMAATWYFPSTAPQFCYNGTITTTPAMPGSGGTMRED